ncbi:MAG: hypothetical protein HYU74_10815 [Dechloromonas sp.]|nr:hypothetical protein [Dechloromonas sp.]
MRDLVNAIPLYAIKAGLLTVVLEALREAWHGKRMSSDEIWRYAKVLAPASEGLQLDLVWRGGEGWRK